MLSRISQIQSQSKAHLENADLIPQSSMAYIFVSNLDARLTYGDIICIFSQFGQVIDIYGSLEDVAGVASDYQYVWLGYEDVRSTTLAVENMCGQEILNRKVLVDYVMDDMKWWRKREYIIPNLLSELYGGSENVEMLLNPDTYRAIVEDNRLKRKRRQLERKMRKKKKIDPEKEAQMLREYQMKCMNMKKVKPKRHNEEHFGLATGFDTKQLNVAEAYEKRYGYGQKNKLLEPTGRTDLDELNRLQYNEQKQHKQAVMDCRRNNRKPFN